jgi:hypothetical protein
VGDIKSELNEKSLPGLYQSANSASLKAQSSYFYSLLIYLILLVIAASVSYIWPTNIYGAFAAASLFLITLGILVALKIYRPDDVWYNGRAVAESVKTRSWRWCMRSEPYQDCDNIEIVSKQFINDLKSILNQNRSLSEVLVADAGVNEPISKSMNTIRSLSMDERLKIYKIQRIDDQANWYALKSQFNKRKAKQWFAFSVLLHIIAIGMLLYKIKVPQAVLPIEVIATAIGAVLTWLQAKKHNELNSSYSLTAHEIILIKGEALSINSEKELSDFVLDSENAFSREHTQWTARKIE